MLLFFYFQSKSSCCYGSRKIPQRRRCTYAAAWKTNHWQTGTLSSLVSPIQNQLRRVFNERCCPLKRTNKWYMPICIFDPLLKQTNKQTNKQMNKQAKDTDIQKLREYWAAMQNCLCITTPPCLIYLGVAG